MTELLNMEESKCSCKLVVLILGTELVSTIGLYQTIHSVGVEWPSTHLKPITQLYCSSLLFTDSLHTHLRATSLINSKHRSIFSPLGAQTGTIFHDPCLASINSLKV